MKPFLAMLALASVACAQNLGDVARRERLRQQETPSGRVLRETGVAPAKTVPTDPALTAAPAPASPEKVQATEQEFKNQRLDLVRKRGELLQELGRVIRDPEAVRRIEEQLRQVQEKAAQLKMERLNRIEERH